jgi:hypothetical protein
MVHHTGYTRWRMHKPLKNNALHFRIETSPISHILSTAVRNPAYWMCVLVIKDAESSIVGHLVLVQTVVSGRIPQTTGILLVKERYQPPMQHIHNGS